MRGGAPGGPSSITPPAMRAPVANANMHMRYKKLMSLVR